MSKKVKYWSGKPTDPEFLNYTKNAYAEVFQTTPIPKVKHEPVNKEHLKKIKKGLGYDST